MSRLIVKNLPSNIKEDKIRSIFSANGGEITDVKLCFTKAGDFRKFGFVGYKTTEQAELAKTSLDKTFIDTSKISVEVCKSFGDLAVSRPWSKHSKGSSAFLRKSKIIEERKARILKLQNRDDFSKDKGAKVETQLHSSNILDGIKELEKDPSFHEFLEAHGKKGLKKTWDNDSGVILPASEQKAAAHKKARLNKVKKDVIKDSGSPMDESDRNENHEGKPDEAAGKAEKESNADENSFQKKMHHEKSDLEWLRSKITKTKGEPSEDEKITTANVTDSDRHADSSENAPKAKVDLDVCHAPEAKSISKNVKSGQYENEAIPVNSTTLKLRGIPFKCKEQDIVSFFKNQSITDIRFPVNKQRKRTGYAFVDFESHDDLLKALKLNGQNLGKRFVELFVIDNKSSEKEDNQKWKQVDDEAEPVADSGRLFIRNLAYSCTEEELTQLFATYGPVAEVNLPVEKSTNRSLGYAFVTFVMPEHAVKALNELNGTVFQGRVLHLLPSRPKKEEAENKNSDGATSSYKKKKDAEAKALSASQHNWNALFLGQNAVADVMASKLKTTKSGILDAESSKSVAVRLALGETEIVAETREFLESHGVNLDVFGQANSARSKDVILVKNLPFGTSAVELMDVFSKYGRLGRVLMPPFGVTGIIEFLNAAEAKQAFTNLAYSKFKHTPLYLEWAPVAALSSEVPKKEEKPVEEEGDSGNEDVDSGEGAVIFVKNLNFSTTEDALRERFCSCGKVKSVTIAKKQDPKNPGAFLSMGYGFVEFKNSAGADKALKLLQNADLDEHKLELKRSHRDSLAPKSTRKRAVETKQKTSKILVRNIPFEASLKEVRELFSAFGEIKTLRLPKKMAGTGTHRGFAFVDFLTKQDAKRAFKALCQSTHLYGRRLVLEWAEDADSVDAIRLKTAQHFNEDEPRSKKRKSDVVTSLESLAAAD